MGDGGTLSGRAQQRYGAGRAIADQRNRERGPGLAGGRVKQTGRKQPGDAVDRGADTALRRQRRIDSGFQSGDVDHVGSIGVMAVVTDAVAAMREAVVMRMFVGRRRLRDARSLRCMLMHARSMAGLRIDMISAVRPGRCVMRCVVVRRVGCSHSRRLLDEHIGGWIRVPGQHGVMWGGACCLVRIGKHCHGCCRMVVRGPPERPHQRGERLHRDRRRQHPGASDASTRAAGRAYPLSSFARSGGQRQGHDRWLGYPESTQREVKTDAQCRSAE